MNLSIINYPHPALRMKAQPIARFDAKLKAVIDEMFDLMYERSGVGLAANQVGIPLRLFVANPKGERGEGEEYVFLNPELSKGKGNEEQEEGCLSLPDLHANVVRHKSIYVSAYSRTGEPIEKTFDGFLARIIQHETDHLNGVLFIDRLGPHMIKELTDTLDEFVLEHESRQAHGGLPSDEQLSADAKAWIDDYA